MIRRFNSLGRLYFLSGPVVMEGGTTLIMSEGKKITVNVPISDMDMAWYQWQQMGKKIQDAFPMLSASEREFILTGITEAEWNEMFKEDEE